MITDIEQETSDIDWFFTDGIDVGFIASAGGRLPNSISNRSVVSVQFLASYFKDLPKRCDFIINPNLNNIITHETDINEYLSCFIKMAEKGLFTFDKTVLNNFSDTNYHLIAKPINPIKFNSLPQEISIEIAKTKLNDRISECIDVTAIL